MKNTVLVGVIALGIGHWWGSKNSTPLHTAQETLVTKKNKNHNTRSESVELAKPQLEQRTMTTAANAGCPTYTGPVNPLLPEIEGIEVIDIANAELEKLKGDWEGATENEDGPNVKISMKIGQSSDRNVDYDLKGFLGNASGSDEGAIGSEKGTGHSIIKIATDSYLKIYNRDGDSLGGVVYSKVPNTTEYESVGWMRLYKR